MTSCLTSSSFGVQILTYNLLPVPYFAHHLNVPCYPDTQIRQVRSVMLPVLLLISAYASLVCRRIGSDEEQQLLRTAKDDLNITSAKRQGKALIMGHCCKPRKVCSKAA